MYARGTAKKQPVLPLPGTVKALLVGRRGKKYPESRAERKRSRLDMARAICKRMEKSGERRVIQQWQS